MLKFNETVIQTAIEAELQRNGQVFYIVPRIAHIDESVALLNRLAPNARCVWVWVCVCVCVCACMRMCVCVVWCGVA